MPRPKDKPAAKKPPEKVSESEHSLKLTYLYGMVAGWARSDEQKQALLMLIGGARIIEVARAMQMKYKRVHSMWRHFLGKVKDDQTRIQQKGIADGDENSIEEGSEEGGFDQVDEDLEDERIEDTSDDDEGEEAGEDERW